MQVKRHSQYIFILWLFCINQNSSHYIPRALSFNCNANNKEQHLCSTNKEICLAELGSYDSD